MQVIHFPYPLYVGDVVGEVTGLAKGSGKWMREGGTREGRKEGGNERRRGSRESWKNALCRKQATRLGLLPCLRLVSLTEAAKDA